MALLDSESLSQLIASISSAVAGFCIAILLYSRRSTILSFFRRRTLEPKKRLEVDARQSASVPSAPAPQPDSRGLCSRLLLDSPVGIVALDSADRFAYANPRAENLLGYSSDEVLGKRMQSLAPTMREELDQVFASVKEGQVVDQLPVRATRKDGRQVELFVTFAPLDRFGQGGPGMIAILFDEYKANSTAQDHSQSISRLQRTHSVGHIGNWEVEFLEAASPDSSVLEVWNWSDEVFRIFGFGEDRPDPCEALFYSLVHPTDRERVRASVDRALASSDAYECSHRILLPDGSIKYVREHAAIELDAAGKPKRMLGTVQDMTEFHLMEEQFLQAQRLESIGRLAGGVAHDFNNLLTIINGYADLALMAMKKGDTYYHHVSEIRVAGRRAAELTDQLLAFSRKQVISPKLLNLNDALTSIRAILPRMIGEDIALRVDLQENLRMVWLDRSQLDQIVMNLAVNARDAMPEGGALSISTSNFEIHENDLWRYPKMRAGKYVALVVSDTGKGMTEHVKRNLFEPFFTTKEQGRGTGLGLASVYGIVRQSGGAIHVESELGSGSTFTMYFPEVAEEPDLEVRTGGSRTDFPRGSEVLLLVEDQPDLLTIESVVLRQLGYQIIEAANGAEAILRCRQYDGKIDLLLTDVVMPGLTGPQLAERIREIVPGIRVLYCSGYSRDLVAARGVLMEGTNYLSKPFSPDLLARKVREVLDRAVTSWR